MEFFGCFGELARDWIHGRQLVSPLYHQHLKHDTSTGEISFSVRSSLSRVSLSLDVAVVGEEDELEDDVEQCLSCLEGVMDVEEGKLEEELVEKPGTTIGTKFAVLHRFRIPFFKCNVNFDR